MPPCGERDILVLFEFGEWLFWLFFNIVDINVHREAVDNI